MIDVYNRVVLDILGIPPAKEIETFHNNRRKLASVKGKEWPNIGLPTDCSLWGGDRMEEYNNKIMKNNNPLLFIT